MADYLLEGPKPARMYEVILPKKLGYFGKVQEVLEDLFSEEAIREVPFVKRSIAESRKRARGVRRGPLDQDPLPRLAGLLDLRDGRPLSLAARGDRRASPGHPLHLPQPRGRPRPPRPTSWPRRSRWSTTWWRTGSPRSWGSRKRSGSSNIPTPNWPSGARTTPVPATRRRPVSRLVIDRYAEGGPLLRYAVSGLAARARDRHPRPGGLEHRPARRAPARHRPGLRRADQAGDRRGRAGPPGLRREPLDRAPRLGRDAGRGGGRPLRGQPRLDGPDPPPMLRRRTSPGWASTRSTGGRPWPRSSSRSPTTSTTTSGSSTPSGPTSGSPWSRATRLDERSGADRATPLRRHPLGPSPDLRTVRQAGGRMRLPPRGRPPRPSTARVADRPDPPGETGQGEARHRGERARRRGQRPPGPRRAIEGALRHGGTVKEGLIELQGDQTAAAEATLQALGYRTRRG